MKLEACPLCQVVEASGSANWEEGEFCVKGKMAYHPFQPDSLLGKTTHQVTVVVLKEHDLTPPPEAVAEAMDMLRPPAEEGKPRPGPPGMVEEVRDVAGHWGLWIMPGDWSRGGKSIVNQS